MRYAPLGSSASTCTSSTCAPGGPRRIARSTRVTASVSPSTQASTRPSGRLVTHPVTPSRTAASRVKYRKPTPWTRPVTRNRRPTRIGTDEIIPGDLYRSLVKAYSLDARVRRRIVPGPGQASSCRPAHSIQSGAPRAADQGYWSRRAVVRCAVVGRVRVRRDSPRPDDRRPRHADVVAADLAADRHAARGGRVLLPPDDQGVLAWRRRLHGRQGEPQRDGGADRGRRAVDRLHADRRGIGRGRCRGDHVGVPQPAHQPGRDGYHLRGVPRARQPARHPRVGTGLLGAHVWLPSG